MHPATKEIIVIASIDSEQKNIIIRKVHPFSTIYQVIIDQELEAQVLKSRRGWEVVSHTKSYLTDDTCEQIIQAALNAESPNS